MNCLYCNHSFNEKLGYCPNCVSLMCKEYILNKKMSQSKWVFKKRFKRSSYIDEIKEWQEHQYDPGYYIGGRILPFFKKPGSHKLFALALFITAALNVFGFAPILSGSTNAGLKHETIDALFIPVLIIAILIIAGVRQLKKAK